MLDEQDEFLVLACDGVWDVCTDQAIVDLVRDIEDPIEASQEVVRHALFQGSTDNITCMVVRLRDPAIGSSDFYEVRTMTSTTTLPIKIPHNPATSTTPTASPRRLQRKPTTKNPDEPFTVTIIDTADLPADAIPLAKRKALDIKPRRAPPLDTATVTVSSEGRLRPPSTSSSSFNGLLLNSPISPAESDLTISEEDETEACVIGGVGVDLDDADADVDDDDDDDEDDDELLYEGIMGAVELSKSASFDRATSSTGSTGSTGSTRSSRILRPPPTDFLHMRATSFTPSSFNSLNGDQGGFTSGASRPRTGMFRKAAEDNLLALELEHNTESSSLDRYGRFKRIVRLEYDVDDTDECAIADSD